MIRNLLCAVAAFSWVLDTSAMVSLFLFGESPYPVEDAEN